MLRVVLALLMLGSAIYLVIRLLQRRGGDGGPPRRPPRPVAPDDDPGFLRDLDDQMWRERHEGSDPDKT